MFDESVFRFAVIICILLEFPIKLKNVKIWEISEAIRKKISPGIVDIKKFLSIFPITDYIFSNYI